MKLEVTKSLLFVVAVYKMVDVVRPLQILIISRNYVHVAVVQALWLRLVWIILGSD